MSFCYTVEDDKSESRTRVNEVEGSESLSFSQLPAIEPNSTITVSIRPKVSLTPYCSVQICADFSSYDKGSNFDQGLPVGYMNLKSEMTKIVKQI